MTAPLSVLVTGCSTGLGLETACHLAAHGFDVHATVRQDADIEKVKQAAYERGVELDIGILDLTDPDTIDRTVQQILARSDGIYGLVNNGGIGLRGCIEDTSPDEIRQVFEANVFGTIALTRAVLPSMRAQGKGRVITITSVGGRISTFGVGLYCSTKFAQEGFAEALALEVSPFGLQSIIIEPGIIKTERWDEHRGTAAEAFNPASPYHDLFVEAEAIADQLADRSRTKPHHVAEAVHEALTSEKPRLRYVVGRPAGAAIMARRLLPQRVFEKVYFGSFMRTIKKRAAKATRA